MRLTAAVGDSGQGPVISDQQGSVPAVIRGQNSDPRTSRDGNDQYGASRSRPGQALGIPRPLKPSGRPALRGRGKSGTGRW
jgi:hypothetical protein